MFTIHGHVWNRQGREHLDPGLVQASLVAALENVMARPKAVAFDIIETCFSLEPIGTAMTDAGFPPDALESCFAQTLRDAFALAVTESFAPFLELFATNLQELGRRHSLALSSQQRQQVIEAFELLSPRPDAVQAITKLQDGGIPVFALTNGTTQGTKKLLERAGLVEAVRSIVSVEDIRTFKPRRQIYLHAARVARVAPSELALVSVHPWDVHGAKHAGLVAAFASGGQSYPTAMEPPDVCLDTLVETAGALLQM
jgi:2-haloacid dehalogenase